MIPANLIAKKSNAPLRLKQPQAVNDEQPAKCYDCERPKTHCVCNDVEKVSIPTRHKDKDTKYNQMEFQIDSGIKPAKRSVSNRSIWTVKLIEKLTEYPDNSTTMSFQAMNNFRTACTMTGYKMISRITHKDPDKKKQMYRIWVEPRIKEEIIC